MQKFTLLFSLGLMLSAAGAQATELVANGSFESPTPDAGWTYSNPDGPYLPTSFFGWSSSGSSGVWSPVAGMFNLIPDGNQAGFTSNGPNGGALTQSFSHIIQAGESITVSIMFGDRSNLVSTYSLTSAGNISLVDSSSSVLSTDLLTGPGTTGTWSSYSKTLTPGDLAGSVGKSFSLVLSSGPGTQASWDLASVQVVPESMSLLALGAGAAALIRRRRS